MKGIRILARTSTLGLLAYLMVGRIAGAAFPVAFVISLAHTRGYAAAALTQGIFIFMLAFGAPLRARMLDVWGSRRILPLQLAVSGASLSGMSVAIGHTKSLGQIVGLSVLVSLSSPAIDPAVRASWRSVAETEEQLALLHTADSILEEAGFLIGPALAAAIMLSAGYQWAPIVLAVAIVANRMIAFCCRPVRSCLFVGAPGRQLQATTVDAAAPGKGRAARLAHMTFGPILQADLRTIVSPLMLMGGTFGVLAITLPGVAARHGSMAMAGFLTALISLGGLTGGLVYGLIGKRGTPSLRHALLGMVFGLPVLLLCIARTPLSVAPLLVISGLAVTPFYINAYLMIDSLIASEVKHEANTWVPVGNDVGYIAGIILGGMLVSHISLSAAMWLAAAFGTALVLLSARGVLRHERPEYFTAGAGDAVA